MLLLIDMSGILYTTVEGKITIWQKNHVGLSLLILYQLIYMGLVFGSMMLDQHHLLLIDLLGYLRQTKLKIVSNYGTAI